MAGPSLGGLRQTLDRPRTAYITNQDENDKTKKEKTHQIKQADI